MSDVIVSSNVISNTQNAISLAANEGLTIMPNVLVVGNNGYNGIALAGTSANDEINIEGAVAGDRGISCQNYTGGEAVNLGSTGSVVGTGIGIDLEGNGGSQTVVNAGYIHGGADGALVYGSVCLVENSGTISGEYDGIQLEGNNGATFLNDASGLITGGTHAIYSYTDRVQISNAGTISATGPVIELDGGQASVVSSGFIRGAAKSIALFDDGDSIQNSGTISVTGSQAIYAYGDGLAIENSGRISAQSDTIHIDGTSGGVDRITNDAGGSITAQGNSYAIDVAQASVRVVNNGELTGNVTAAGASNFNNSGTFTGLLDFEGGGGVIRNSGHMTPGEGGVGINIAGASGQQDLLVNNTTGVIGATGTFAVMHGASGVFSVTNRGEIDGDLSLASQTSLKNTGAINGNVTFSGSDNFIVNTGSIDGSVTLGNGGDSFDGRHGGVSGSIIGGAGPDTIRAGDDGETLAGGAGHDVLYAGKGADTFVFSSYAPVDTDAVHNFDVTQDTIELTHATFTRLAAGATPTFAIGTQASGPTDYLFYNDQTGGLYYDPDGSGTHYTPRLIATLDPHLALTSSDFLVV